MKVDVIKILLIDDDEEDYIITKNIISNIPNKKYILDWVSNMKSAMKSILQNKYDVYLVDYRLGTHTGLEIISEATKKNCKGAYILLTGQGDTEIDQAATKVGAADYLVKSSITPFQLERSIRYSMHDAHNLERIRKLNQGLEKSVEQRTEELAKAINELEISNEKLKKNETRIIKALEKEKELNELKSRFVTIASHEFRTPLSAILSSVSLIGKYYKEEEQDKRIKHIYRIKSAVKNLTNILNDFLSISKLEEGKVSVHPSKFNIVDFTKQIMEEMQSIALKNQKIIYRHFGKQKTVNLDLQITGNVMINLLSNALKYSPQGNHVEFETNTNDHLLVITVKDNGIGIPEEDQPFLFNPFFRSRNVENIKGTGLGLNIVKKYIDMMNGTITFTSKKGCGTCFTVTLPNLLL